MSGSYGLMRDRRFLPLFLVQFLSALGDNVYRSAMLMQMTFLAALVDGRGSAAMAAAAAAAFILPFFLFSATAGQLSDKLPKSRLVRWIKMAEVALMLLGGTALVLFSLPLMFLSMFLLGTSAAFFGPLKYSLLPELLPEEKLVAANGLVEGGTFLAILLGTIIGGVLVLAGVEQEGWFAGYGSLPVLATLVALAAAASFTTRFIPLTPARMPELRVRRNFLAATWPLVGAALRDRVMARVIFGISWLWFVGSVFLALFPNYVRDVLAAEALLTTVFLGTFSIGIGAGSVFCQVLSKRGASTHYVPLGALGMALGAFALYAASLQFSWAGAGHSMGAFLQEPAGWAILLSLFFIAFCGGIFSVPLYVLMQVRSPEAERARVVAANNIINAAFMVGASAYMAGVMALGGGIEDIFHITAWLGLIVALYIVALLPQTLLKTLARWGLRLLYRVEIHGLEHAAGTGQAAVYVVNHVSLLDGLLVGAFLPGRPVFAVNTQVARKRWVRLALALVDHYAIDPANPLALKALAQQVQSGRPLVIFPEGRVTMTGALMKVYEGPGLIADKTGAPLIPIRIDGAQYTPFSYLRGKVPTHWFPKITLTVMPAVTPDVPDTYKGRKRRQALADYLYHVMSAIAFTTAKLDMSLWQALLAARRLQGGGTAIIEDVTRRPMTYNRLVLGALALGGVLARQTARREAVALLLPNAAATAVSFFALQAYGRVPAMLNFTAGLAAMQAALRAAQINHVITSRVFVEKAKLGAVIEALGTQYSILYLEELAPRIGFRQKLGAGLRALAGAAWYRRLDVRPEDAAVILFTSGSEGAPKGVALSHRNILANRQQLGARIDFNAADIVFNALPVFHSFGLTGGFLLPVLAGVRTFLYPSPLHYRIVPELAYDTNATILFGTDTFLTGYARMAHPYDFYSLRYVFAGAERVRPETRDLWAKKFGLRVLEGYGATETAPALAINTPMAHRPGTVGQLLPGIEGRLEAVPGIAEGGKLLVRGPNIMLGYLKSDRPGVLQPPEDGWYDTGDIVTCDADGFITIVGRAKRFAKIAGEMVSLNAVEQMVQPLLGADKMAAVIAVADERKGEQLVLFTTDPALTRETAAAAARERHLPELMIPRNVVPLETMPLLGTGKVDYVALKGMMAGS